ncbi:hypothetical protein [Pseudarthrobacter sp. DSP2-3-2b1]|uniref:hypothetical protein n=1 Tax=Pseudarthrobacter sp. DSP2-3-2b1 TaxID=2804661 RepID=UPI003CEEC98F
MSPEVPDGGTGDPGVEGLWAGVPEAASPGAAGAGEAGVGAAEGDAGAGDAGAGDAGAGEEGGVVGTGDGVVAAGVRAALEVAAGDDDGTGDGVSVAPADPSEMPNRSFSGPLSAGSLPEPAACPGRAGGSLPLAAYDAGTPAEKTSIAPMAAAAAPRRSPPWTLVRERESSDL